MKLSDLCRYYLRCLSVAYQDGVVVGQSSATDYMELPTHPIFGSSGGNLLAYPEAAAMANRARAGLPKKELMLGYPVCRMREPNGKGWRDVLKPIFIWELRFTSGDDGGILVAEGNPVLNPGVIASFDNQVDVIAATVSLAEELGINRDDVEFEKLCARLREARSGWPWTEELVPSSLSNEGHLAAVHQNGIYNRAIILAAEPSNFTKGLETELSEMAKLSDATVGGTALEAWLRRDFSKFQSPPGAPTNLLEPLPLNSEQREAIGQALSQPLTVITGPPGTGKSQVVSTLLINAAVRGKRVLFSSKNNKAVDVVEQRVNELGALPLLLRMGNDDHRQKLQMHIGGLLGSRVSPQNRQDFAEAQADYRKLELLDERLRQSANDVIELRNRVDHAEQAVEAIRKEVGDELFHSLRNEDAEAIHSSAMEIAEAAEQADRLKKGFLVRLFWPLIERRRMARLDEVALRFRELLHRVGVKQPDLGARIAGAEAWANVGERLTQRAEQTRSIGDYSRLLLQLSRGERLEAFLEALDVNQRDKALVSKRVWDGWLRVMPDRLTEQARGELADFASVLRTIIQAQANKSPVPASVLLLSFAS